ncbi:hypothetical protein QFC21_004830 [Naganishia friedmannii]|uniref:Uncharacterized protein n=1 Tax=Naganishia friedmannii TaxID=89922 RepID=A0ACC2VDL9_9TREE|nr:hypothetical protein QFC21_004830 [Naganishia friedmannii]
MVRFKVRPRRDNVIPPCATELSTLLACFATSGDLRTTAECSKAAKDLHMCMASRPKGGKPPKSSVSREMHSAGQILDWVMRDTVLMMLGYP